MISIKGLPPSNLAKFQQEQIGNGCAITSACAAINLLYEMDLQASTWIKIFDSMPFPRILKFRMLRNGPTTPKQQMNQIKHIAETSGVKNINISLKSGCSQDLKNILNSQNRVALVTLGWFFQKAPEIVYGLTNQNYNATKNRFGYHTMLVAAHDSLHICADGLARPWGFINSWINRGNNLFWMSEAEFYRAWSIYTPFGGVRSMVVVGK